MQKHLSHGFIFYNEKGLFSKTKLDYTYHSPKIYCQFSYSISLTTISREGKLEFMSQLFCNLCNLQKCISFQFTGVIFQFS